MRHRYNRKKTGGETELPVQRMRPIRPASMAATIDHMAQVTEPMSEARRDHVIAVGMHTYNEEIAHEIVEHYGTEGGTPLRWAGSGCAHFGLEGEILTGEDMFALVEIALEGRHPETGQPLRQRQRSDAIAGYGFIHSDPKPQGLLRLHESHVLQTRLDSIHERTNLYFLNFLERESLDVRIKLEPNETYRCLGFVASTSTHHTSGKGDPHAHDHLLVYNVTPVEITTTHPDGTTSVRIEYRTLDSRLLERMRFAAGEAATQYMRRLIEEELGLKTELNGDITALADADLIKEFSKARQHILKLAEQQGGVRHGAKSDHLLWLMTRRGRASADIERAFDAAWNDPIGRAQVIALWRAAVAESGHGWLEQIDVVGVAALQHMENHPGFAQPRPAPQLTSERRGEIVTQIVNELDNRATFTPEWVLAQAIKYGEGYWETTEVEIDGEVVKCKGLTEQLVDDVLADSRIVKLRSDRNTFSTKATIDTQANSAIVLEKLATSKPFDADTIPVLEAAWSKSQELHDGITWDAEQKAAFDAAFSDTGLVVWMGVAGSGKSTLVKAVHECYEHSVTPIMGYAVAGAAVERLRKAAPSLECDTVASLVMKLDRGEKLPAGVRIIVDEFYQLSLLDAHLITQAVNDAGGQLIMLGDPRQAQAIDGRGAGSIIAQVAREHGKLAELNMVYRIRSEKIKSLASAARTRDIPKFLEIVKEATEAQPDRENIAEPELIITKAKQIDDHFDEIAKELGKKWHAKKPPSAIAIAFLNDDVNELARRIQTVRWGYHIDSGKDTADLTAHDQFARVGDQVRTRYPIKRLGVFNGREWRLMRVHHDGSVDLKSGRTSVRLDADYVSEHLELAYASTGHSAQGGGWDEVYGCFRGEETSTWAYNVITRSRNRLKLYTEIPVGTGDLTHFWKAVLQRDDEQIAALLQAEQNVREQAVSEARIAAAFRGIRSALDDVSSSSLGESQKQSQPRINPNPSDPRRPSDSPFGPI